MLISRKLNTFPGDKTSQPCFSTFLGTLSWCHGARSNTLPLKHRISCTSLCWGEQLPNLFCLIGQQQNHPIGCQLQMWQGRFTTCIRVTTKLGAGVHWSLPSFLNNYKRLLLCCMDPGATTGWKMSPVQGGLCRLPCTLWSSLRPSWCLWMPRGRPTWKLMWWGQV